MSKGNVILGYARGSIGDVTLARVKGQQIARARNRNPKNPKSPAQMTQRIKFAPVTKFYQQGKSGLLPFSFATKKPLESDFNAFMRENLTAITPIYPTKEELNNKKMWLPNNFVVANGSKTGVLTADYMDIDCPLVRIPDDYKNATSWSSFLAIHPELHTGDIVTMAAIKFNAKVEGNMIVPYSTTGPECLICQFTIGEPIDTDLDALFASRGFAPMPAAEGQPACLFPNMDFEYGASGSWGIVWYTSKVVEGVTEESFAQIALDSGAKDVVAELSAEDHLGRALVSWGASDAAILQGSLSGDVR